MKYKKIGFIGLGLIGGSIAQKIKTVFPDSVLIATAHQESAISEANAQELIANASPLELSDFSDCDLIFLCAPVEINISCLFQLKDVIGRDCIITDVSSTKTQIHKEVIALGLEKNFIGGHPMTGSEKTGFEHANPFLLENAYYLITPTAQNTSEQIDDFFELIKNLGAIPLILDYEKHDFATAAISHLPHMIAYTLVNLVKDLDDDEETLKTIAAGGFKDITRIASSSPVMWKNICTTNREPLLNLMDCYLKAFQDLRNDIADVSSTAFVDKFQTAKDYRDSLSVPHVKSHHAIYELYLDLADEAGGIAIVASLLAFKGINIKNIGIIHNREFEEGVLRIEFYDEKAVALAEILLLEKNYTIYKR